MHRGIKFVSLICCTLLLALAGCGGGPEGPELGTVAGKVTLNGEPLANVRVIFNPGTARPSAGKTDANGNYELTYTADNQGAAVGTHQVIITSIMGVDEEGNEISGEKEVVPARYNADSELTAEVTSGSNEINFELTE